MTRRLLAAALAILAACHGGGAGDQAAPTGLVRADTATVQRQWVARSIVAIGRIVPRPGTYAELGPAAPARVARVYVAPGDRVKAGAPLVSFDQAPFSSAAASAEAALTAAQQAADRAHRLAQQGILPRKDVEKAEADLAQAQAAAVAARRDLRLATLRAPVSGVVTQLSAVLGDEVQPGEVIVSVADPDALDLLLSVSPAAAGEVTRGDTVLVTSDSGSAPIGRGTVRSIGAAVDSVSGSVEIRVAVPHPGRPLRVGETLTGRIELAGGHEGLVVPQVSLVTGDSGSQVFVVGPGDTAHAQPVHVGVRTDSIVELLDGVTAGQVVVSQGADGVADGSVIRPGGTP